MSKVFEATLLPEAEKERLCRELLAEFALEVKSHAVTRQELIIPCTLGDHSDQERNPTGALNYEKLTYKCLGCQRSGGLLWFIAEHRGTSATDARRWLAKETGTDGEVMDLTALLRYFEALYGGRRAVRAPLPKYADQVLDPWMLLHPWVTDPIVYDGQGRNVGGRGVPEENAARFKIGYAERYPMGFTEDDHGNRTPLPPSERIVLPHYWQGRLVGWQSRRLANDGTPKYKSTGDFPKDSTLFNYDPQGYRQAVVVESPFSVVRHDHHTHMVGTFGANITERQIKLLGRYERLVFWLDADQAGWNAYQGLFDHRGRQTKQGVLEQVSQYTDVWVVQTDLHADPADLDDDRVQQIVATQAVPWVLWEMPTMLCCHRCGQKAHEGGCP